MSERQHPYDAEAEWMAETIARNIESIKRVPADVLPEGEARDWLLTLANDGNDLYCYQSGDGRWYLWLHNSRWTLAEYVADFQVVYVTTITTITTATDGEVA